MDIVLPCEESQTHINIIFNNEVSFSSSESDPDSELWKTFVSIGNVYKPEPSKKTVRFLDTLKYKENNTIQEDEKESLDTPLKHGS